MASVRTELALMRTGFTVSSFGTVVTQLLGRDNWNPWVTDGLSLVFLLLGMIIIESALARFRATSDRYGAIMEEPSVSMLTRTLAPRVLQLALAALVVLVIVY